MKQLFTEWGQSLDPNHILCEYPRPQLKRNQFIILNGLWEYAISEDRNHFTYDGNIIVPFSPESILSTVNRFVSPNHFLFYHKQVSLPVDELPGRWILHFDAVDQEAEVYVNDHFVGSHIGGFTHFSFDVTDFIIDNQASIRLRVIDISDTSDRQTGKQRIERGGIFYTPQSGIWQTVWMEKVPLIYITSLIITPLFDLKAVKIAIQLNNSSDLLKTMNVTLNGTIQTTVSTNDDELTIPLSTMEAWTPETPTLYNISIEVGEDHVESFFGMRKFERKPDVNGIMRFYLNNQPTLLSGVLDQGYYPDGLLTPPSDEAMVFDIMSMKSMGFNFIRKHIKVEPLRWYYHCDRLGIIVWQDMVSGSKLKDIIFHGVLAMVGISISDHCYRLFGRKSENGRKQFLIEMEETVHQLQNVTSISTWVPFNEAWGQFDSKNATKMISTWDPTRLIDHASGWHDQGCGDYKSSHIYFTPIHFRKRHGKNRILALTEFGGYSWMVQDHSFHPEKVFGYRKFASQSELNQAVMDLYQNQVQNAVEKGLSILVYTQLTDVEDEVNGFYTYDRKIEKINGYDMLQMNKKLMACFDKSVKSL